MEELENTSGVGTLVSSLKAELTRRFETIELNKYVLCRYPISICYRKNLMSTNKPSFKKGFTVFQRFWMLGTKKIFWQIAQ